MKGLVVGDIDKSILRRLISDNHYSGTCSRITVGYGVWYQGLLRGGIVFSAGANRHANGYCRVCRATEMIELTRLWLHDDCPKNSESRAIGVALRALKKGRGRFRAVLSYADAQAGHIGTIYQATNFYYMGTSLKGGDSRIRIGDVIIHRRTLTKRYGTASVSRLKEIFGRQDIQTVPSKKRKHAYVYPLEPKARAWLEAHCKPYPKHKQ